MPADDLETTGPVGIAEPGRSVLVVGAGVVGLATAFELRRHGHRVAVVDPAPLSEASRAAAGMLAPISEVQHQQDDLFPLMTASGREYPAFVDAVQTASGLNAGYRTDGTLVCGVDAADRGALTDLAGLQRRHGMTVEPVTTRTARALEPFLSPRLSAVFDIPSDHQVDPRLLGASLRRALDVARVSPRSGATDGGPVRWITSRAVAVDRAGDVVTGVRLEDGSSLGADDTVLVNGLGLTGIAGLPPHRMRLRPVHGDILRTCVPPALGTLLTKTVRGLVAGVPVYLVPRADGTLVIGATSREDDMPGPNAGGLFRLLRDAQRIVPAVADVQVDEVIARARPGTPDDIPYLGRLTAESGRPLAGLVVSTGYFRHGILLSALAARLTAALVQDGCHALDDNAASPPAGLGGTGDAAHLATMRPDR